MTSEGEFVAAAFKGQASGTLEDVADIFGVPDGPSLGRIQMALERLDAFGLECVPPATKGELDTVRTIKPKQYGGLGSEFIERCRLSGEGRRCEYKSSMLFDHKRYRFDPNCEKKKLRSEAVRFSLLKAIVALMNVEGGHVLVGVSDDFEPLGLSWDLVLFDAAKKNLDNWELGLRQKTESTCKDGRIVNDYFGVNFLRYYGVDIAVLEITPRASLTFLNDGTGYKLYRRQGNRSMEVKIEEIEEFLDFRARL